MNSSSRSAPVQEANKIVTDHLISKFLLEAEFFYDIVETGEQFILISDKQVRGVFDASNVTESNRLLEAFCEMFADKNNILVDVRFKDEYETPALQLTLQDGSSFLMLDFSTHFVKL